MRFVDTLFAGVKSITQKTVLVPDVVEVNITYKFARESDLGRLRGVSVGTEGRDVADARSIVIG